MDPTLEALVWERADSRCEYCRMPQKYDGFLHEIDHVLAKKHGGRASAGNLALACFPCNNHKGPNIAGYDPITKKIVPLFHPRKHKWDAHFVWHGTELTAKTRIGRVTILVLEINSEERKLLRQALVDEGVTF